MEHLIILGILLVFIGVILILLGSLRQASGKAEVGGVVLIGPFPIVFGSSKEMVLAVILLSIFMLILILLLIRWYGVFL